MPPMSPPEQLVRLAVERMAGAAAPSGLKVPVDVHGADYLALFSSMEVINFPEYIEALTRIFKRAGISWTISSKTFEATNSGIQIGDSKVAAELVGRVVSAAEALGVKYVISPECGHAYMALRWMGANMYGKPLPFKVLHITEYLAQLKKEGKWTILFFYPADFTFV